MNFKRKKPKNCRAGCLMCKANKINGQKKGRGLVALGHYGFGKIRKEYHAYRDLKTIDE